MNLTNIHKDAKIGKNVIIEPFVTIEKDVEIGDNCWIGANAVIKERSRIGDNCKVFHGAVIGAIPQDLKYKGEETYVEIGNNTTIRECVTINLGTAAKQITKVGNNCLLMAYSHVAHDCILKDNIIIGNATQIAGEVEIDDYAILSGACLVHQFVKIGKHVIIQGGAKVVKDIPPYITAGREPLIYAGVNSIGLRRRKFTNEQIAEIQQIYRTIYNSKLNTTQAIQQIEQDFDKSAELDEILQFIKTSSRGIIASI